MAAVDAAPARGSTYHVFTNRPGDSKSPVRQFARWWSEAMAETQAQTLSVPVDRHAHFALKKPGEMERRVMHSTGDFGQG